MTLKITADEAFEISNLDQNIEDALNKNLRKIEDKIRSKANSGYIQLEYDLQLSDNLEPHRSTISRKIMQDLRLNGFAVNAKIAHMDILVISWKKGGIEYNV